ncbi:hypothetical protein NE237_023614 [Protea cynaroides]|uniref:Uncharacterized protein n=1 Tax=Protea cynaroides TaxID=273540 RepID=A0A9Q0HD87_9MAGN|nr:hypothetical protein NE237_023614 [Protea cynaroides]
MWSSIASLSDGTHYPSKGIMHDAAWVLSAFDGGGDDSGTVGNKLAFSVVVAHLWQERNLRIFRNKSRSKEIIIKHIKADVSIGACLSTSGSRLRPEADSFRHLDTSLFPEIELCWFLLFLWFCLVLGLGDFVPFCI